MSATILRDTLGLILLVAVSACGMKPVLAPIATFPSECSIPAESGAVPDTITAALTDFSDQPDTFWDAWSDHPLVVGHLYETLVTVDCLGGLHPGLADSWRSDGNNLQWTFVLRKSARFWDGSRVRAIDVQRSLMDSSARLYGIDSVEISDDRRLTVIASDSTVDFPRVLASPSLAVKKVRQTSGSALGSGAFRLVSSQSAQSGASVYTLKPTTYSGKQKPVLLFSDSSGRDARDLLLGDVDLLVTSDPAVLDYARRHNQFSVVPLPWDQTYVLLSTTRISDMLSGLSPAELPQSFLDRLARDAVRRDARGHQRPAWFDQLLTCGDRVQNSLQRDYDGEIIDEFRRILYDRSDPVARHLAERIVALGRAGSNPSAESDALAAAIPGISDRPGTLRAHGAAQEEMQESLALGSDFAYIIAQPLRSTDPCTDMENLLRRAFWVSTMGHRLREGLIPLVDTRKNLIVRRGEFGLTFDWFGNIRVDTGSSEK